MELDIIVLPEDFPIREMPYRSTNGSEQILVLNSLSQLVFIEARIDGKSFFRGPCEESREFCAYVKEGNDPLQYDDITSNLNLLNAVYEEQKQRQKKSWFRCIFYCLFSSNI